MNVMLFDFGGTLDTNGIHWSEQFWAVYERHDVRISKPQFEEAYRTAELRMANANIGPEDSLEVILRAQIDQQLNVLAAMGLGIRGPAADLSARLAGRCYGDVCRTVEQIRPVLRDLHTKYRLGVVSNFYGNLTSVTRELAIDRYFDVEVDSTVVGVRKPDPEIFRIALKRLNCDPARASVVGDSYDRDIVPAKSIGCTTIWLDGKSWKRPERIDQADRVIHRLQELPALVGSLHG